MEKTAKPMPFSGSSVFRNGVVEALPEREEPVRKPMTRTPLAPLVHEWLLDVQVAGRSPQTIDWYRDKMEQYRKRGGVATLEELDRAELKRLLVELQEAQLAANTRMGYFMVLRNFLRWALEQGYPVDPTVFRVKEPKLPQLEMEAYDPGQLKAMLAAAPAGWHSLAIQILLGTGMRVGEMCALELDDLEDEGDATFLRIRHGKGNKFRRVPVSRRLRRELVRYVNRSRSDSEVRSLLVMRGGRPVTVEAVSRFFQRLHKRVGFRVHAHKFRHTFATQYLRRGGEMERLRRILGHTTYTMVMRYVHLNKSDLWQDFEQRTPF